MNIRLVAVPGGEQLEGRIILEGVTVLCNIYRHDLLDSGTSLRYGRNDRKLRNRSSRNDR